MKTLGYYNGRIGELDEMSVPMLDRGAYFGDGVYDASMCVGYVIHNLEEHLDRFYRSAALLNIEVPLAKETLRTMLCELVRRLDDPDQFVYWQVTRGTAPRSHAFPNVPANLWIMLTPEKLVPLSREYRLISVPDTRFEHCNIKTLNLLPSVMAYQQARSKNCDEAVFHKNGFVTECAHSNIHILHHSVLVTHPADHRILSGIARAHLIRMCGAFGIPVLEQPFTMEELCEADEVIVTSCSDLCIRARELDGKPIGGKSPVLLKQLQDALWQELLESTKAIEITPDWAQLQLVKHILLHNNPLPKRTDPARKQINP